jgi:hypothetical protein
MSDSRYTPFMADEQRHVWEPEELQKVLAANHREFEEQHKLLMARLAKPFPEVKIPKWAASAATKEADARLKALQEYVRNLPRKNSITD